MTIFHAIALAGLAGSTVAVAHGQRVNFAKFQETVSSTTNGDYEPSLATDGLVSNHHSFRTANTSSPHWLEVRFPMPLRIGSAHLYLGLANNSAKAFSGFRFQFHNGSGWEDVPGTTVTGNTATERVVPFPTAPTSDRFRIYSNDNGNRIVREMALLPVNLSGGVDQGYPLGTDVRLSVGYRRPATATSTSGDHFPKHAVDGHVTNSARWLSDGSAPGEALEIDLLSEQVVGSAHVYSGGDTTGAITDFDLRYWDGSSWLVIPGTTVSGNADPALVVPFAASVTTSRIRLHTNTASTARIKELLLFPPRTGGYPLGQDVVAGDPPAAQWDDFSDSSYRLRNAGPDLRLALVEGEVRFVHPANPAELLEWQLLLNHRDGSYRVRHTATGLCLSQPSPESVAGDLAIVEDYTALPWQDWTLDFQGGNEFRLLNAYSGLVLQSRFGIWADGNPIALASPAAGVLQRWIAGAGRHHPKKGLAGFVADHETFRAGWSYHWGRATNLTLPFWHSFEPMQWGNFNWKHGDNQGPLDLLRNDLQSSPKPTHLLGFNEPDKSNQANMPVADAIARWPRLEAMDVPLVAPAPANGFNGWLADFSAEADARGYRRDYTAVHWYGGPNADSLIAHLEQNHTTFGRPVWLTEFAVVRWSGGATWSESDTWNFLAEFLWRAESLPWLKRYSLFQFTDGSGTAPDPPDAPRLDARTSGGLTPAGELYAGWDGVTAVEPHKACHLQTRGYFERIVNGGAGGPGFTTPADSGVPTQWVLLPQPTAGEYRLVSLLDGRPLRFVNGSTVSLGTPGHADASVTWRPVEHEFGWHFIEHPATNKRLKNNGNGTFGMVSITNTGSPIQWRFVVPAVPADAAPPDAPPNLAATASPGRIDLVWSPPAAGDVVSYEVSRSDTAGGPHTPVATGITSTSWTDDGLPDEVTRHYVVKAIDVTSQASDPSPEASATTPHPFSTYAGWAAGAFASEPGADPDPAGDPDLDGRSSRLEYVFLTDPVRNDGSPFRARRGAGGEVIVEFPWNWRAAGHQWRLRHGSDLAGIGAWPVIDPGPVNAVRDGDVDHLSVTPPSLIPHGGFLVLEVVEVAP